MTPLSIGKGKAKSNCDCRHFAAWWASRPKKVNCEEGSYHVEIAARCLDHPHIHHVTDREVRFIRDSDIRPSSSKKRTVVGHAAVVSPSCPVLSNHKQAHSDTAARPVHLRKSVVIAGFRND